MTIADTRKYLLGVIQTVLEEQNAPHDLISRSLQMANDELAKQEALDVETYIIKEGMDIIYENYSCPSCNLSTNSPWLQKGMNYCPSCGQRISWKKVLEKEN